jgi:hypothetical protein
MVRAGHGEPDLANWLGVNSATLNWGRQRYPAGAAPARLSGIIPPHTHGEGQTRCAARLIEDTQAGQ